MHRLNSMLCGTPRVATTTTLTASTFLRLAKQKKNIANSAKTELVDSDNANGSLSLSIYVVLLLLPLPVDLFNLVIRSV